MSTESVISPYIEGYLEFRKGLGFKVGQDPFQLNVFEKYLSSKNIRAISQITSEFVRELVTYHLRTKRHRTVNAHLKIMENFFDYLQRNAVTNENPFSGPKEKDRFYFSPYVLSDEQIERILTSFATDVATSTQWAHFLPRTGRYSILFLMARCGLRISEACNIKVRDVSFMDKTIFIEKTKFYKDRLIPVSNEVMGVLKNYLSVRANLPGHARSESLFLSFYDRKYSRKTVGHFFHLKMKELELYREPHVKGHIVFGSPCPHSLRHSFAVRTVRRWYAQGLAVDQIADTLATYMGHASFDYTRLYLKDLSRNPAPLIIRFEAHGRI